MPSKRNIITVTDKALKRIKELIDKRRLQKETLGIRIAVKSGGCSGFTYKVEFAEKLESLDEEQVLDIPHENEMDYRIFIDPKAVIYILGTTLDYAEEKFKSGFTFINPNESGRCGCGESFYVK